MNSRHAIEAADTDRLLASAANPQQAAKMAAYLRDQFDFYGVPSPERRRLSRPLLIATRAWSSDELIGFAESCWNYQHREVAYVGLDALVRRKKRLAGDGDLTRIEGLIRTRSWWDTVDLLAAHPVGQLVFDDRALASTMDVWIDDADLWIARTAILHQLNWGADTDAERLFGYVDRRAESSEFFIRKACGWALRAYARVAPQAVRTFVESRRDRLSGLTVREALKHAH